MSWGPLPSQICPIASLKWQPVGSKVRFLGCVTSYSPSKAILNVGQTFPRSKKDIVHVNIELVLETIHPECIRRGEWVNVVGYINGISVVVASEKSEITVQAVLVWPTGPLDLGRYEMLLEEQERERSKSHYK